KNHPHYGHFLKRYEVEGGDPKSTEGSAYLVESADKGSIVASDSEIQAKLLANPLVTLADGSKVQTASALFLLQEEALSHSLEEYAELSGVSLQDIQTITQEFTSHGTKAAVCQYHGCGNYLGGTQASYAVALLNVLIGSVNKMGGYLHAGGSAAPWNKGRYDLTLVQGKPKASGVKISREGATYEESSEYQAKKAATGSGYPAKRPWFSFTRGGLCVEAMNGIDQRYPYGCQILCTFFFNPVYSIPGGTHYIETLTNQEKVPLHISLDICVNESNIYADYIVPDLSWVEGKYAFMGPHAPALKFSTVRIPAIEPLTGKTKDGRAFSTETFLIDVAEYLKLPGFGDKAIKGPKDSKGESKNYPLHKPEDFYLKALANLAFNAQVPQATPEELKLVEANQVFARHKDCVSPEEWPHICKIAAQGGVFPFSYASLFDGDNHKFGLPQWAIYNEKMATSFNALTGKRFAGTASLAKTQLGDGTLLFDEAEYPFLAVTYKMQVHAQSRSISHAAALELFPENFAQINLLDAQKLGLKEGEEVRLISVSCPKGVKVKAHLTELIRPGCVALSFHYGHTQMGASELKVKHAAQVFLGGEQLCLDENTVKADPKRGRGASF
ncbi:MAG: molybdopterin oxidoreductase, partial [Desulfovibrionaceae bacterium]|nr:molybdopterin oxidoreductase [Desulfovibrionaceae bacterium]